jgi:hypothetical protein
MISKSLVPLAVACLLLLLSGCKKNDDSSMFINPHNVTFGYTDQRKTITISNGGSDEFTWTVSSPSGLFGFSKTNGRCSKNKPDSFDVILLREKVHADSISAIVTITTSTGESANLSLLVRGFPEKKIRYSSEIYNAVFDQAGNRLILLSASNSAKMLDIYDLATDKFTHLTLPGDGTLLAVSPDGTYAVTNANSNTRLTITNLVENTVGKTYNVDQFDDVLVATNDKSCYFFPSYDYYKIDKLNVNTGSYATYSYSSYFDINTALLHPSGKYIYTSTYNELSKFNISGSVPTLVYANSGVNTDNKIWIAKDGTKIITAERTVLFLDPELPQNDITRTATISIGQNYINAFDQNLAHNEFYIVPSNSSYGADYQSNQILVLNSSLAQVHSVPLEPFYESSYSGQGYTTVEAYGQYVFSSSDGSKIIVISKSSDYYSTEWGIEIIDRTW